MTINIEENFFEPKYTRGQVCKVLGVTRDTLRHYEKCGILNPQENADNKYKYYSIADLEILTVILFLRAMDIPIQDIPKFIECKDVDVYSSFLEEQIDRAIKKINYWNSVKTILSYLKKTIEDYKNHPNKVSLVENTLFRVHVAKFKENNYGIEEIAEARKSNTATYHVIKLRIIEDKWVNNHGKEPGGMIIGHLCNDNDTGEDIYEITIPKALTIITLEDMDNISKTINRVWEENKDKYEFTDKVYIVENTVFNIFSQKALFRTIYLPIIKVK